MGFLSSIGGLLGSAVGGPAGGIIGGAIGGKLDSNEARGHAADANAYNIALQEQSSLRAQKEAFNQKMELAKQHGIHPLAMLGAPMSTFSPAITAWNDSGSADYGTAAGRSFVKPPDESTEPDPIQSRIIDAQLRTAEANAKRAEWEALISEFQAQDMAAPKILSGQPGNPPGMRMSNDVAQTTNLAARQAGISPSMFSSSSKGGGPIDLKQEVLPPHPLQLGTGAATDQTWINVIDQDGKVTRVLNPKAIQADYELGATITQLSNMFGPERAIQMVSVLENSGTIGGVVAGTGYALKKAYDYFKGQANRADSRRGYGPGRGRGAWRAAGPRNE